MGSILVFVIIGAFVLFLALMTWALTSRTAGERGWVFNKHNPRPCGMGSLGLLESIYQPSIEYVVEERSSERARGSREESGDKPEAGREDPEA